MLRVDYRVNSLALLAKLSRQIFIDRLAMADGYEMNHTSLAVDGVNDLKAADAIRPSSVDFSQERLPAFRVGRAWHAFAKYCVACTYDLQCAISAMEKMGCSVKTG